MASALQDAGRAKLVGETTFGTGTILTDFGLDDGSVLSIGTVEWLTRAGRSVWHTGVQPDVVVQLPAGASPLTPATLRSLSEPGLLSSGDAQLLEALQLLRGGAYETTDSVLWHTPRVAAPPSNLARRRRA